MSYDDIIENVSGAVKGFLEWTSESIKSIVQRFKDKKLAFIQDEETIRIVREQYSSGELNFYKIYLSDEEDILFLVKLGLTLRRLESNPERRQNLRSKILKKYDINGLHVAQFVANGLLNRYIGILIDNLVSVDDFKRKVIDTLKSIEKYVLFVKAPDSDRLIIQTAKTKVFANEPTIFIVSGMSIAAEMVRRCERQLTTLFHNYELERISSSSMENLFYKRKV